MNLLAEISRAVARISTLNDFIIGMDFLINRLQLVPFGYMSREQLEALYLCSSEKIEGRNHGSLLSPISPYKNVEKIKTTKIWKEVIDILGKHSVSFTDIIKFTKKDIERIIRSVPIEVTRHAITGAPQIIQDCIFKAMTDRGAAIIKSDMEFEQEVPQSVIDDAQEQIVEAIIYLMDMGDIDRNEEKLITRPKRHADFKPIGMPKKSRDNLWHIFAKTGIPPRLKERLIANGKVFFKSEKNTMDFETRFNEMLRLCNIAYTEGILSLECEISDADSFTAEGLELICDATETAIIDEILSNRIIQDEDIDSQFLKYMTMRALLYIQNYLPYHSIAKNMLSMIPDEFMEFKNKLSSS